MTGKIWRDRGGRSATDVSVVEGRLQRKSDVDVDVDVDVVWFVDAAVLLEETHPIGGFGLRVFARAVLPSPPEEIHPRPLANQTQ